MSNSNKITKRQIELLICIKMRTHQYSSVSFVDLLGDIGVSGSTLADHLDALVSRGYVETGEYGTYRHHNSRAKIVLTPIGEEKANEMMREFQIYSNEPQVRALEKIRANYVNKKAIPTLRKERRSDFSNAFNELIIKNPTEPVISSIGMYTELDTTLGLLATNPSTPNDRDLYLRLSQTQLNLPIRNARISSIVIPAALRKQIPIDQVARNLEESWHWFRTVNNNTIDRYVEESKCMGLISMDGGMVSSLKTGATGTMEWLASKTISTFLNAVPNIPKASILTFRESFAYPTKDEVLNPSQSSSDIPWAEYVHSEMSDKELYREIIGTSLEVLVDQTGVIVEEPDSGRLIPRTIIRRLAQAKDMEDSFKRLLKLANENNPTATLLLIITAHPGITVDLLFHKLTRDHWIFVKVSELQDAVRQLAGLGLIHTAGGNSAKLYAFTQIPYVIEKKGIQKSEINAVLKGMNPSILTKIGETMNTMNDKVAFTDTLERLTKKKEISFDDIEAEYGKPFSRKFIMMLEYLKPFTETKPDTSGIIVSKEELSSLVLDVTHYSLLTSNDALNEYATLLSDIVVKDSKFKEKLVENAKTVESAFISRGMRM